MRRLKRILSYSAIAGGVALGWHLLSRTRRQLQLANNLGVNITHARIGRITWAGALEAIIGIRLNNPTRGSLTISHPVVELLECSGGRCDKQVGRSEATGRQYVIPAEGTLQLDDTKVKVSLGSQLANLTRIGQLLSSWQQTGKAGLSYRLVVKTNVPGIGLVTTEKEVAL